MYDLSTQMISTFFQGCVYPCVYSYIDTVASVEKLVNLFYLYNTRDELKSRIPKSIVSIGKLIKK